MLLLLSFSYHLTLLGGGWLGLLLGGCCSGAWLIPALYESSRLTCCVREDWGTSGLGAVWLVLGLVLLILCKKGEASPDGGGAVVQFLFFFWGWPRLRQCDVGRVRLCGSGRC